MLKKIINFFKNYRKKRLIRIHLNERFKDFRPKGLLWKLNPMENKSKERRVDELTESIFRASKIVEYQVKEQKRIANENNQELLLNKLKKVIDEHYGDVEKENSKLKEEISKLDLKFQTEKNRNTKIKELTK